MAISMVFVCHTLSLDTNLTESTLDARAPFYRYCAHVLETQTSAQTASCVSFALTRSYEQLFHSLSTAQSEF